MNNLLIDLVVVHESSNSFECLENDLLFLGYSFNQKSIKYSAMGRPYFIDIPVYFSISHSNNLTAIAYSKNNISIDIEYHKDRNFIGFSRKYFSPTEQRVFNNSPNKSLFYAIWCAKEAILKYTEIGIKLPALNKLDTFNVPSELCHEGSFYKTPDRLALYSYQNQFTICVCGTSEQTYFVNSMHESIYVVDKTRFVYI
ncbi:4'-phosphopantetheinyl transferase family protein [Erysipelothrix aquatica]|uniref:4'-phosphopantetheinyl transferase family protein n=1 Tax=Erysipelothrix aquatica TaxID=2683714 RepID=UPI001359AAC3|nr:4'-phosphopantetheinyl transferase superfamily protein [Erysipelothrix aquatica]